MVFIQLEDLGVVSNGLVDLIEFFIGAASNVVGSYVFLVDLEEGVAVIDWLDVLLLLDVGTCPNIEGLFAIGVLVEFCGANLNEIVDIYGLF